MPRALGTVLGSTVLIDVPVVGPPPVGGIGFGAGGLDGAFGEAGVGGGTIGFEGVFSGGWAGCAGCAGSVVPGAPCVLPRTAPGDSGCTGPTFCSGASAASGGMTDGFAG